jgi:hypothetical protein
VAIPSRQFCVGVWFVLRGGGGFGFRMGTYRGRGRHYIGWRCWLGTEELREGVYTRVFSTCTFHHLCLFFHCVVVAGILPILRRKGVRWANPNPAPEHVGSYQASAGRTQRRPVISGVLWAHLCCVVVLYFYPVLSLKSLFFPPSHGVRPSW